MKAATALRAACTSAAVMRCAITPAADASRQPWDNGLLHKSSHVLHACCKWGWSLLWCLHPAGCISDLCLSVLPHMGLSLLLWLQPAAERQLGLSMLEGLHPAGGVCPGA